MSRTLQNDSFICDREIVGCGCVDMALQYSVSVSAADSLVVVREPVASTRAIGGNLTEYSRIQSNASVALISLGKASKLRPRRVTI